MEETVLPDSVEFEWDEGNRDKNWIKHNVSNKEAEDVFISGEKFLFEDAEHSQSEKRYMIWGTSKQKRKLTIFFTFRKNKIRIISARDMHKKERRSYEEKIKAYSKI